ncbi:MAG: cell division protein FtsL [Clostridiales bacterium]|nr:cell division protein FtsL [Eubacteriales bacterium]MDH7564930.1 cell division protein FtsL [Clostridiales bacterium]
MIKKGENYVYGSTAEKIKYDVYEENKVLKEKKKHRTNNRAKLRTVCAILIVFAACFTIIYRYAAITELNYKVVKQNKIYESIKDENTRLRVEISKETDLNKIRAVAESKLGMQRPDKYQIVYMNVAKNDYTEAASAEPKGKKTENNILAGVWEKLDRFTSLLY